MRPGIPTFSRKQSVLRELAILDHSTSTETDNPIELLPLASCRTIEGEGLCCHAEHALYSAFFCPNALASLEHRIYNVVLRGRGS